MQEEPALTSALGGRIGGQGVSEEAVFAAVAVEAGGVVNALEALARLAVAVPHGVGVDVVVALAEAARPHSTVCAQRVSEIGVVTQLAPLAWDATQMHVLQQKPFAAVSLRPPLQSLLKLSSFLPFPPSAGARKVHKTTHISLPISKCKSLFHWNFAL